MKRCASLGLLFVITAVLLLAGCGSDIDQSVTFYRGEAWEADMSFSISAEMLALLGGPAELEAELDKAVQEAESLGAKASWNSSREDTTLIYAMHVEGEGFDTLREIVFDNNTNLSVAEVEGQRQVYFSHPVNRDFLDANSYTLTLTGGEIIASNGQQIDDRTVQWVNPSGRVEAVLTEKSRFGLGAILLIVALAAGAGGGGWFFWRQQSRQQMQLAVACAACGQPLAPQAQFCPKCGHKR